MTALSTAGCAPVTGTRSHCEQGHRSTKRRHLIINPRGAWQRGREWRDLAKVSFPHFLIKNTDSFLHLRKHHIYFAWISRVWDFRGGSDGKSICLQCRRPRFNLWVRKIPWRRKWQPIPVFLPGESHGWRSLGGYSPWGLKESDITSFFKSLRRHVEKLL